MWKPAGSIGERNIFGAGRNARRAVPQRSPPQARNRPSPAAGVGGLAQRGSRQGAISRYQVPQGDGQTMEWELLGPAAPGSATAGNGEPSAAGHHYGLRTMEIALDWICLANISFRGAAKCFMALGPGEQPSFWTIRLWVLRVGLYELARAKVHADDWVLIVDATVAVGQHKAVVVLGVPLWQMEQRGFNLGHQDVVSLAIRIVTSCNGAVVQEALAAATQAVGVPSLIVSDGGSEVKKGVSLFQAEHPEVVWNYDLSHRFALLLEKELGAQAWWAQFMTQTGQCRQECQQTAWSHLQPPALRVKARWLNVKPVVTWALKVIGYGQRHRLRDGPFARLFGWLEAYEKPLQEALQMITLLEETSRLIKHEGLNRRQVRRCDQKIRQLKTTGRVRCLGYLVMGFLWEQVAALKSGQTFLDCSDVLESLFGKFKALVERSPLRAITESVLLLAALTSSRTEAVIREAMETVSAAEVRSWFTANGEPSLLAKRRRALG